MASKYLTMEMKEESSTDVTSENRNLLRWSQRTKMERMLLVAGFATFILVFVVIVTLVALDHICPKYKEGQEPCNSSKCDVCLTPGCVKAASDMLSKLDETVDPCDDFYRFACGGWMDNHPLPEDRATTSVFSEAQTDLYRQLKVLLEKEPSELEPRFIKMVHKMYSVCMDLEGIEKRGVQPLTEDLKVLGGWPLLVGNAWNGTNFDWVQTVLSMWKLGYNNAVLFDIYPLIDARNNTFSRISLGEAALSLPDRSYFENGLNDTMAAAYFSLMVKSAKLFGARGTTAEEELLKVFQFESDLSMFTLSAEESRNFTEQYNIYTVGALKHMIPQVPWLKYISGMVGEEISENESLIIKIPELIKNSADLITRTEKRVVANYLLWKVVFQSLPYLSKEFRQAYVEYYNRISGTSKDVPRWRHCLNTLAATLGKALSSYYVRNYFTEESKNAALEMFDYIHEEFLNTLEEVDWMDEEVKSKAKAKVKALIHYIGYPEELLNNTVLLDFYENLTVTNDSYFANIKRIRKWSKDFLFSQLRKPNIRGDWRKFDTTTEVNAYYKPKENGLAFLAGMLRNSFFSKEKPNYMNFGAAGFILAHEIIHGFDDVGRQFNKDGIMVNWWDEATEENFLTKVQCIIEQYSNYTAENGLKINGQSTQGENIADNGGLKLAYKAYLSWIKDNSPEQRLPGLNYSPMQILLISSANAWCGKFRSEALKIRIKTGTHPPNRFRVLWK